MVNNNSVYKELHSLIQENQKLKVQIENLHHQKIEEKDECQKKVLETLRHHDLKWIHTRLDIHRTYGLFSILSLIFSFVALVLAWRAFFN